MAEYWGSGNLGGGGSGGADKSAILITAPKGTTSATATYGGKTVKGKLKDGYWRIAGLEYGPGVTWTVTISNSRESASQKQPMEKLEIVYLEMSYWDGYTIFESGEEFPNVTGGWEKKVKPISGVVGPGDAKNEGGHLVLTCNGSSVFMEAAKEIDLSRYRTINASITEAVTGPSRSYLIVAKGKFTSTTAEKMISKPGIVSLDISSLKGPYNVGLRIWSYSGNQYKLAADRIWFE